MTMGAPMPTVKAVTNFGWDTAWAQMTGYELRDIAAYVAEKPKGGPERFRFELAVGLYGYVRLQQGESLTDLADRLGFHLPWLLEFVCHFGATAHHGKKLRRGLPSHIASGSQAERYALADDWRRQANRLLYPADAS